MRKKGRGYYYDHGGSPRRWEPLGSDKAVAFRRWAEIRGGESPERTVNALIDRYCLRRRERWAASTARNYERMIRAIRKYFGEAPVEALKADHLQDFVDRHPRPQEARNTLVLLTSMLRKAVAWGWRMNNPGEGVDLPPVSRRERYMTDAEFLAIREKAPPHVRIAMDLAYTLSLRVSDVVRLRVPSERAETLEFVQKKTGEAQAFTITPELREIIDRALRLPRPVRGLTLLCGPKGLPYAEDTISRAMQRAARAAGVYGVRFHDLRAKSASDEQETAQRRLGHRDSRTTQVYLRKVEPVVPIKRKL